MRKFAKILIPVLLLVAIVASCTLMFSSAADENVIYIAAEARGDGSGKGSNNAMGHGNYTGTVTQTVSGSVKATKTFDNKPYAEVFEYLYTLNGGVITFSNSLYEQNAFYKAFNALKGTGGKIVVVDEVKVDAFSNLQNTSIADTAFPTHSASITVTSIHGSDNYKSSGAKLVFDHSRWNSGLIEFMGPVVLKDLNVEYRYNTKSTGNWEEGFSLYTSGKDFTVDTGVTVTSVEYADNGSTSAGNRYMNIFAGRRYPDCTGNPVITIKSGNWRSILSAGHGNNNAAASAQTGSLTGNVTINVSGGNVQNIYGGGSAFKTRPNIKVKGNVAINVTGGEVGTITATTGAGAEGVVAIDVKNPAAVSSILPATATVDTTSQTIEVTYEEGSVDLIVNADKFTKVDPPFNPNAEKVIYISSTGTGNGKSPASPMGHGNYTGTVTHTVNNVTKATKTFNNTPYAEVMEYLYTLKDGVISFSSKLYEQNVLYKAFNSLKDTGGKIVVMDEVKFDAFYSLQNTSVADTVFPENKAPITVTSIHGSNNYKSSGAKLVFDHSYWNSGIIEFMGPVVLKDLDIEYRYNTKSTGNWISGFSLYTNGKDFTVDTGVTVTSVEVAENGSTSAGNRYINILAGRRYLASSGNPVITIKSGTFSSIYGAGHSNISGSASLTGNVTINVSGGKIASINGGGVEQNNRKNTKIEGNLAINVTGGEVDRIIAATSAGVSGDVDIDIKNPATVSSILPATATANATAKTIEVRYDEGSVDLIMDTDKFTKVDPPFNPNAEKVIYISSTGTGNGKSPANPMGHGNYTGTVTHKVSGVTKATKKFNNIPYADVLEYLYTLKDGVISFDKNIYEQNAFYRAFKELAGTGGRIVVMDEVKFDTSATLQNGSVSDAVFPANIATITVTSIHDSNNYKNSGAKLVFDHSHWNSGIIEFMGPVVLKDLDIEYRYNTKSTGNWINGFSLYTSGMNFTVDTGVTVTSVEFADNGSTSAGDRYINILAGRRFAASSGNPVITIKSGTFSSIYGAGHSNVSGSANLTGNVTINVSGGKVASINGGGVEQNNRKSTKIVGNLAINITGGEVVTITAATSAGVSGDVDIDIKNPAKVGIISAKGANATAKTIDLTYVEGTVGFINVEGFTKVDPPFDSNVEPPFIPDIQKVIYISANGTGDGSSPESPLGNAPGYKENLQKMYDLLASVKGYNNFAKLSEADQKFISNLHKDNVLYRAFEKASSKDTVIVLVGDVAIDIVSSRMTYKVGEKQSPAELTLPASNYNVTITSVFGGQDYRSQAKLVLDFAACNTTFLTFKSATTIENINIEHRYNNDDKNYWSTPFIFAANCNKFVIGKNVKVTSFDTSVNAEGNWYPAIIGGHRFSDIKGDANVTIKSGTWSFVNAGSFGLSGTYGKIDGNATLNIEGGRIEAVYGTSSFIKPTASITKKLTINITGGFVEALYATAKNGAANEIVVNIAKTAERVAKAWGGVSEAKIPANATINYDRSVIRDDEVKYWTTVNSIGKVEDQPEPYLFTLYIANVSKGKGDGSSPENAMGHAEGYAKLRKQALDIIAKNKGTNSGLTSEQNSFVGSVYLKNALYRALTYAGNKIVNQGGRIVVCGPLSIDATDAMRKSLAEFRTPVGAETITITSYDGTTNFRAKGAKLVLDNSELGLCVQFGFPVILDNLTIEHKYNSSNGRGLSNVAMLAGNGNKITVGYNVNVIATDVNPDEEARIDLYPTIVGGHRYTDSKSDNYVIVSSGQWAAVVGGDWGSAHTGNATIGINGGKIGTVCGTTNPTNSNTKHVFNGSVWIGLWGGEVDNVYVVGIPGMIWGDASIGLGGTTVNGRIRAVHADYEGEEEIQAWVFNYTGEKLNTRKVIGFESPVPATGSALPYLAVVATVSLVGAVALIVSKKKKAVKN